MAAGTMYLQCRRIYIEISGTIQNGQIWKDAEKQIAVDEHTIFMLASMTKPVTAAALMMLSDAEHDRLADRAAAFMEQLE